MTIGDPRSTVVRLSCSLVRGRACIVSLAQDYAIERCMVSLGGAFGARGESSR